MAPRAAIVASASPVEWGSGTVRKVSDWKVGAFPPSCSMWSVPDIENEPVEMSVVPFPR